MSRCRSSPASRHALKDGAPLVHEELGTNQAYNFSAAKRRRRRGLQRRRGGGQAAHGQPAPGPGLHRDARHRRPVQQGDERADHLVEHPDAAPDQAPPGRDAGHPGEQRARDRARRGRRLRLQAEYPARRLHRAAAWPSSRAARSSGSRAAPRTCKNTVHGRDMVDYIEIAAKHDGTITRRARHHLRQPGRLLPLLRRRACPSWPG